MMKTKSLFIFAVIVIFSANLFAEEKINSISPEKLMTHVKFLSDDLLEGRGIDTRGGHLAKMYIESYFKLIGLKPAFETFTQPFKMNKYVSDEQGQVIISKAGEKVTLRYGDDFTGSNLGLDADEWTGKALFIGYGIHLPGQGWDYYKDTDVKGKLLIGFTNEPGQENPEVFKGKALTRFGRWTYKYEEAARQGAVGLILIHTDKDAGYGWDVVRNSWSGATFKLVDDPYVLPLQYWVRKEVGEKIAKLSGTTLAELRAQAEQADFKPVPLNVEFTLKARLLKSHAKGINIAGMIEGSDPALKKKAIVISAHYDHLGIGNEINGDKIYNGAMDNGTALAAMMELAAYYSRHPEKAKMTLIFTAVDAEEEGLLGSLYFARNPSVPTEDIVANINYEMSNPWGRTRDILVIGGSQSQLGDIARGLTNDLGLILTGDTVPEQGYFFRSDQFSFAREGIPALWLDTGVLYEGKPDDWGNKKRAEYRGTHYHRPSDEIMEDWDLRGLAQLVEFTAGMIQRIQEKTTVEWKKDADFKR